MIPFKLANHLLPHYCGCTTSIYSSEIVYCCLHMETKKIVPNYKIMFWNLSILYLTVILSFDKWYVSEMLQILTSGAAQLDSTLGINVEYCKYVEGPDLPWGKGPLHLLQYFWLEGSDMEPVSGKLLLLWSGFKQTQHLDLSSQLSCASCLLLWWCNKTLLSSLVLNI